MSSDKQHPLGGGDEGGAPEPKETSTPVRTVLESGFVVQALRTYKNKEKGSLSFKEGQLIQVWSSTAEGDLYYGVLEGGKKSGFFPCYYVIRRDDINVSDLDPKPNSSPMPEGKKGRRAHKGRHFLTFGPTSSSPVVKRHASAGSDREPEEILPSSASNDDLNPAPTSPSGEAAEDADRKLRRRSLPTEQQQKQKQKKKEKAEESKKMEKERKKREKEMLEEVRRKGRVSSAGAIYDEEDTTPQTQLRSKSLSPDTQTYQTAVKAAQSITPSPPFLRNSTNSKSSSSIQPQSQPQHIPTPRTVSSSSAAATSSGSMAAVSSGSLPSSWAFGSKGDTFPPPSSSPSTASPSIEMLVAKFSGSSSLQYKAPPPPLSKTDKKSKNSSSIAIKEDGKMRRFLFSNSSGNRMCQSLNSMEALSGMHVVEKGGMAASTSSQLSAKQVGLTPKQLHHLRKKVSSTVDAFGEPIANSKKTEDDEEEQKYLEEAKDKEREKKEQKEQKERKEREEKQREKELRKEERQREKEQEKEKEREKTPRNKGPSKESVELIKLSFSGLTLEEVMLQQKEFYPHLPLPIILTTLCHAILVLEGPTTEGIFRVPGTTLQVEAFMSNLTKGICDFNITNDPHVPASLLKGWMKGLYEPVIPVSFHGDCKASHDNPEESMRIVSKLSSARRRVVYFIVQFLQTFFLLQERVEQTRMTAENMATMFTPCFFGDVKSAATADIAKIVEEHEQLSKFLVNLFKHMNASWFDHQQPAAPSSSEDAKKGESQTQTASPTDKQQENEPSSALTPPPSLSPASTSSSVGGAEAAAAKEHVGIMESSAKEDYFFAKRYLHAGGVLGIEHERRATFVVDKIGPADFTASTNNNAAGGEVGNEETVSSSRTGKASLNKNPLSFGSKLMHLKKKSNKHDSNNAEQEILSSGSLPSLQHREETFSSSEVEEASLTGTSSLSPLSVASTSSNGAAQQEWQRGNGGGGESIDGGNARSAVADSKFRLWQEHNQRKVAVRKQMEQERINARTSNS
ncbi:DEAD (Asp-Glu-Ala-Asp) box polypeptide 51 [Balamuthia mandrillaris]